MDNPEQHLTFKQDAVDFTDQRGEASIKAFGLDRPDLLKSRLNHLKKLLYMRMVGAFTFTLPLNSREQEFLEELNLSVEKGRQVAEEAQRIWREAAFDSAEYAGMVRANYPHLPRC